MTTPPAARLRPLRRELLPLLVLLAACCLFFWRAVALRGVFFHYDHALQNYPYRAFFARGLAEGRMPLWTPDLFCGFPLLAESQGNSLYPPFLLLFRFLPAWVAYNYYTVFHFLLAALGAYWLARVLRIGRAGATVAGLCYMLTGPLLAHAHHTNIVVGIAWLPILLALIELACRRRSAVPLLGFAAATGALALGAQPQYTLYCALACGAYLVWRLRIAELAGMPARSVAMLGVAFGLAGALGALLAAGQLLPLVELISRTTRAGSAVTLPTISPGVPGNVLTMLLPHYWGSPGLGSYWGASEPGLYAELTLYLGMAPLMLALTGALADRSRRALFFVGLGALSLLFALGFSGGFYSVFALLPIFRSARFPSRFAFVTALCVAMLAGMGLEALLRSADRRRVRRAALASAAVCLLASVVGLALTSAYTGPYLRLSAEELARGFRLSPLRLSQLWTYFHSTLPADVWRLIIAVCAGTGLLLIGARRAVPAAVLVALWCGLIFGELAWTGRDSNPVTTPRLYTDPPPLATFLRERPPGRIYRYMIFDDKEEDPPPGLLPFSQGWAANPAAYARCLDRLPQNANMLWGIPSVSGFSPLQTRALKRLLGRPNDMGTLIDFDLSPVLDLLGARWILTLRPELPGGYVHAGQVGDVHVFENPAALPRAFIVHRATSVADDLTAVELLRTPGFDYRERILLHASTGAPLQLEPGAQGPGESARVAEDDGDLVVVQAELERPGYLVLADQHYPGWRVAVDGQPAELLRADYLLRAVRLPAGRHEIRFAFRPASYRLGLWASFGGLGVLAVGLTLSLVRRRRRPADARPEPDPLACPYGRGVALRIAVASLAFLLLGLTLYKGLWSRLPIQLDPHWYSGRQAVNTAARLTNRDRSDLGFEAIRQACIDSPDNPLLRDNLAKQALRCVLDMVEAGRMDEAREVAREAIRLAPREVRKRAPALFRLAKPDEGEAATP